MVEIHNCLPLMGLSKVVEDALIFHAAQISQSHTRSKIFKMAQSHQILAQRYICYSPAFVGVDPFGEITRQKLFSIHMFLSATHPLRDRKEHMHSDEHLLQKSFLFDHQ